MLRLTEYALRSRAAFEHAIDTVLAMGQCLHRSKARLWHSSILFDALDNPAGNKQKSNQASQQGNNFQAPIETSERVDRETVLTTLHLQTSHLWP